MGAIHHSPNLKVLPRRLRETGFELRPSQRMTDAEFMEFCAENPDMRIEQDKNGKIILMPPVDFTGGIAESDVHGLLYMWWYRHKQGRTFSPATGFKLPDTSTRSADGAWASDEKIAAVKPADRQKFAPLVPDFVVEVRSNSDRIGKLKKKMTDTWIANGVRLAWLIDPKMKRAYIYRPGQPVEELQGFDHVLSGENVCVGLQLDLKNL